MPAPDASRNTRQHNEQGEIRQRHQAVGWSLHGTVDSKAEWAAGFPVHVGVDTEPVNDSDWRAALNRCVAANSESVSMAAISASSAGYSYSPAGTCQRF
jgi:hypothetical protein